MDPLVKLSYRRKRDALNLQEAEASERVKRQKPDLKKCMITDKVYKDECAYCFQTPFFPDGLFVCLKRYVGFCGKHVHVYCENNKDASMFLNMKYEMLETQERNEVNRTYTLRICPNFDTELSMGDVKAGDEHMFKIVTAIIDSKSSHLQENFDQGLEWDGTEVFESDLVKNLVQLNVKKEIPDGGWVCEHEGCEIKQNLWLNLADAFVGCGRQSYDCLFILMLVSYFIDLIFDYLAKYDGKGHAETHARDRSLLLVVRIATIDNEVGECFEYDYCFPEQYSNDRYVKNPGLKKHLAHFGLDISKFEKTEEHSDFVHQNYNQMGFFAIQETGSKLEAVYGPGFTGLINMGSSCYINSVLQLCLAIPDILQVYDRNKSQFFVSKDPIAVHDDFNCQFEKIIHCLKSSDDYSKEGSKLNGIKPVQFRRIVGKEHYEFSTMKQQDVEQYTRHLLQMIDDYRTDPLKTGNFSPVDAVRFLSVNRFEDIALGCVRYRQHHDYILPLLVPIDSARQSENDPERKVIRLDECVAASFADEMIEEYVSPVTQKAHEAKQCMRMGSFPDFLLVQIKRFAYNAVGEQEKLKVDVEGVDVLDLNAYLLEGLQPGEQSLPDSEIDEDIVNQLIEKQFDRTAAEHAVRETNSSSLKEAESFLASNFDSSMGIEPNVRRGIGSYTLQGFISHIGSSPSSGHYVAHLKKNGIWYIFNDEKVAVSKYPPKAMGYLYLYRRCA